VLDHLKAFCFIVHDCSVLMLNIYMRHLTIIVSSGAFICFQVKINSFKMQIKCFHDKAGFRDFLFENKIAKVYYARWVDLISPSKSF